MKKLRFNAGSLDKGLKFLLISKESLMILNLYSIGTIELSKVPCREPWKSSAPAGFLKFKNLVEFNFVLNSGSGHKNVSKGLKEKIDEERRKAPTIREVFL